VERAAVFLAPAHAFAGTLFASAVSLKGFLRNRSYRQNYSSKSGGSRAELLVDADTHSIDAIRSGIEMLKLEMGAVHTTVFAGPGLSERKKWPKLLQEAGVSFHPVPRSSIQAEEPNDNVIAASVRKLCHSTAITCIAVLVSDKDYAAALQEAMRSNKVVVAVCPAEKHRVVSTFEEMGIRVLRLPQPREKASGTTIRAILDEDGGGHVQLAEAYLCDITVKESQEEQAVVKFLGQLGYRPEDGGYMISQIAKFWFTNALGPLTVYPTSLARKAVFELMGGAVSRPRSSWKTPQARQAFFLPRTNTKAKKFGGKVAYSIFEAGGPFLLQDSNDLVARALRKLGYLDSSLNKDLAEALLVFVNNSNNKHTLRKIGALPSEHDQASTVHEALRQVFLSDCSPCQWYMATKKDVPLRQHLCREGFLSDVAADRSVVFQAMRSYAKMQALPEMRSYLGYSLRIMAGLNPNPMSRGLVEFQC